MNIVNIMIFDAQEVVSKFLTVFQNRFVARPNLRQVSFKFTFTIVNHQTAPSKEFAEINNSKGKGKCKGKFGMQHFKKGYYEWYDWQQLEI